MTPLFFASLVSAPGFRLLSLRQPPDPSFLLVLALSPRPLSQLSPCRRPPPWDCTRISPPPAGFGVGSGTVESPAISRMRTARGQSPPAGGERGESRRGGGRRGWGGGEKGRNITRRPERAGPGKPQRRTRKGERERKEEKWGERGERETLGPPESGSGSGLWRKLRVLNEASTQATVLFQGVSVFLSVVLSLGKPRVLMRGFFCLWL